MSLRCNGPFCGLILLFLIASPVYGQDFGRADNIDNQGTAYHVFSQKGEATVQVLVLGAASPGIYEIGVGVDLGQLLALSGGVSLSSSNSGTPKITIRLFHDEGGHRDLIYERPLEEMLAEPGLYPPLRDGDVFTIEVKTKSRISWSSVFATLRTVLTTYLVIDRIRR